MPKLRIRDGVAEIVEDDNEERSLSDLANERIERDAQMLMDLREEARRERMRETREGREQLHFERYLQFEAPRQKLFRDYLAYGKDAFIEERAQSENTGSAGGFIVPQGFYDKVLVAAKKYDGIFDAATVVPTFGSGDFKLPLDDDSANAAAVLAENVGSSLLDNVWDSLSFPKCPKWSSGICLASTELAADSFSPLVEILSGNFGRRFARGVGAAHTATLLTAATLGVTAASATAVTADEVLSLVDSVDAAHGDAGSFLMRLSTWTSILKLKSATGGNYMVDEYERDSQGRRTLFGFPVYISPSMGPLTTGQKTICFGNLSRFIRREVRGSLEVKTLIERYAEVGQVGYLALWRTDGALAKATSSPIPVRYLQQA